MIRAILKLFKWAVILLVLLIIGLALPVGYTELACIRKPADNTNVATLPTEHHRDEARTLLTYPEWHIVHAYDDYAPGDQHRRSA